MTSKSKTPTPRPVAPVATNPAATPAAATEPDFVPSVFTGWIGVLGFIAGIVWLNIFSPAYQLPRYWEGLIIMAFTSLPMIVHDAILLGLRGRRRGQPVDGMTPQHAYSVGRTFVKLVGLLGTLGLVIGLYWVFPEYNPSLTGPRDTGFYSNFFTLCREIAPWALGVCAVYFFLVDARLREPRDGYWHFGRVVLLSFDEVDWAKVRNHLRTWAVKGFFLPLMFTYLCDNLPGLHLRGGWPDFMAAHRWLHNFLFSIDLAFVACGYVLTLRWVQSHVRSAEPTALGWVAALVCYMPFWKLIGDFYLGYWSNRPWDSWLQPGTTVFYLWGGGILFFEAVFVWATVSFGLRFSNLTHRGIVRRGPYYFTKHPAYVSKILAFLMISVPWLDTRGANEGLRNMFMLSGLAFVYWIRAKTEERHLASIDPAYSIYADEVRARHRRWLRAVLGPLGPKG
jgi:protein-S-isoprenylcysteine O-methyltransferase Ste14